MPGVSAGAGPIPSASVRTRLGIWEDATRARRRARTSFEVHRRPRSPRRRLGGSPAASDLHVDRRLGLWRARRNGNPVRVVRHCVPARRVGLRVARYSEPVRYAPTCRVRNGGDDRPRCLACGPRADRSAHLGWSDLLGDRVAHGDGCSNEDVASSEAIRSAVVDLGIATSRASARSRHVAIADGVGERARCRRVGTAFVLRALVCSVVPIDIGG